MVRDTLQEISALLERYNWSSNELAIALLGDDKKMWDYLVSNAIWGGAGSIADHYMWDFPNSRRQLETLLIRLGREQMSLGRVNERTEMWVTAFESWKAKSTPMSHQAYEGWFPECLVCGCGNVGPIVCLDPACHQRNGLRKVEAIDQRLVTHDGHSWKLCQLCERRFLSDPAAWGSFALCVGCWNTFARAGIYPPTSASLLVAAVERGEVVLRPEVRVRKIEA